MCDSELGSLLHTLEVVTMFLGIHVTFNLKWHLSWLTVDDYEQRAVVLEVFRRLWDFRCKKDLLLGLTLLHLLALIIIYSPSCIQCPLDINAQMTPDARPVVKFVCFHISIFRNIMTISEWH